MKVWIRTYIVSIATCTTENMFLSQILKEVNQDFVENYVISINVSPEQMHKATLSTFQLLFLGKRPFFQPKQQVVQQRHC